MTVVKIDFMKSREAERQRYIRKVIRKIPREKLTRSARDVLLFLVNLWFYHKSGPKGYIHPSAGRIAKKTDCSIITAKRALGVLRDIKVISAVKYLNGGARMATQYKVDIDLIVSLFDPHGVTVLDGELIDFLPRKTMQNDTVAEVENDTVGKYQNDTLCIDTFDVSKSPSQEAEHE